MKYISSQRYKEFFIKEADYASGHWRSELFDIAFSKLPLNIQEAAKKKYNTLLSNPESVIFKKLPYAPKLSDPPNSYEMYSFKISESYRALCVKANSYCFWYWIGTHQEYNYQIGETPSSNLLPIIKNVLANRPNANRPNANRPNANTLKKRPNTNMLKSRPSESRPSESRPNENEDTKLPILSKQSQFSIPENDIFLGFFTKRYFNLIENS